MLSTRLVKIIEDHAEELTRSVIGDLRRNPKTPAYHRLSEEQLHSRVHDVFRNFGEWLEYKPEEVMEGWYRELGKQRYAEEIPLSEVVHALLLTKYHLQDYIRFAGLVDSALELYQEMELQRLAERFFDKAIYYTVDGYLREFLMRHEPIGRQVGHAAL